MEGSFHFFMKGNAMNILLVSQTNFEVKEHGIYMDLIEELAIRQHQVFVIYPLEKRQEKDTYTHVHEGVNYLGVKTGNLTKNSNLIEKGLSLVRVDAQYIGAIKKYLSGVKFDLVLYSTPPISLVKTIRWIKKQNPTCRSYLMLKDIFPQNAVDLGMMGEHGLLHQYFSRNEKALYAVSDGIGVMSPANKTYLELHHPEVKGKVNLFENALKPTPLDQQLNRDYFGLPNDKVVFVYGGNLGKPQTIPFVVECLKASESLDNVFFAIAGSGGEKEILETYLRDNNPRHVKYFGQLQQHEYQQLSGLADIGLIFLDSRFTIPNYPQRVLTYLELSMPILCATDVNSDVGTMAETNGYGFWCESNDVKGFVELADKLAHDPILRDDMGQKANQYFMDHFTVEKVVDRFFDEFVKKGESQL